MIAHGKNIKIFAGNSHPELAEEVLNKFASRVENFAVVEQKAKLEGRNMTMLLAPNTSK